MPKVTGSDEKRFLRGLQRLFSRMIEDIRNGSGLIKGVDPTVRTFMQSDEVKKYLDRLVGNMVQTQRKISANSWREAAYKSGNGPELYRLIREEMKGPVGARVWELIAENAGYIKTLPEAWAAYANQYAFREALKGRRPEDVEAELRKVIPAHIGKNLKCIARTECAKANAAIVQSRAEWCGIRAYIWRCVTDERSRDSHIGMDGILVFYDDPPSPEALFPGSGKPYGKYHAGNTFNCRCYQEPVVDNDFLPDLIRVHDHGEILTMTKAQLLKKYGNVA